MPLHADGMPHTLSAKTKAGREGMRDAPEGGKTTVVHRRLARGSYAAKEPGKGYADSPATRARRVDNTGSYDGSLPYNEE